MRYAALSLALVICGCAAKENPAVDLKAEEQAIHDATQQWQDAANKKDVAGAIAFYTNDGTLLWPDAPPAAGTDAIRTAWQGLLGMPGLTSVQFIADKITVAQAGDLASDFGRVVINMQSDKGPVADTVKYLVNWKKVDGQWKVMYDAYNSNHPAMAPPAPAPPTAN